MYIKINQKVVWKVAKKLYTSIIICQWQLTNLILLENLCWAIHFISHLSDRIFVFSWPVFFRRRDDAWDLRQITCKKVKSFKKCLNLFRIKDKVQQVHFELVHVLGAWLYFLTKLRHLILCIISWMFWFPKLSHGSGTQPGIFQGKRGFLEWGHPSKHFIYNAPKRGSAGKKNSFLPEMLWKLHFNLDI